MNEIGAFEAKNRLGSLLDRVERGEEITITRHGRPVARLVPVEGRDRKKAGEAIDRILARKPAPLKGITIRELIDEGRR